MTTLAAGPFLDWEELTGQSKFIVDIISVPIFSAIAGSSDLMGVWCDRLGSCR